METDEVVRKTMALAQSQLSGYKALGDGKTPAAAAPPPSQGGAVRMHAARHADGPLPFTQVHPTAMQVRCCGYEPVEVRVAELSAGQPGCYFAWKTASGELHMIQPSLAQVKMCSPDAFESAIQRGEGAIVPVAVSEVEFSPEMEPK